MAYIGILRTLIISAAVSGAIVPAVASADDGQARLRSWQTRLAASEFMRCELQLRGKWYEGIVEEQPRVTPTISFERKIVRSGFDLLMSADESFDSDERLLLQFRSFNGQSVRVNWRLEKDGSARLATLPSGAVEEAPDAKLGEKVSGAMTVVKFLFGFYRNDLTQLPTRLLGTRTEESENDGLLTVTGADGDEKCSVTFEKGKVAPGRISVQYIEEWKENEKIERNSTFQVLTWGEDDFPKRFRIQFSDRKIPSGSVNQSTVFVDIAKRTSTVNESSFALTREPPENSQVNVPNVPYECVWRDNKIQPLVPQSSKVEFTSNSSWILAAAVSVAVVLGALWFKFKPRP